MSARQNILLCFLSILFLLFSAVSCSGETSDGMSGDMSFNDESNDADNLLVKYQTADEHAVSVSSDIIQANNAFAAKLFNRVAMEETGKNIMISPLSISIALAMTMNAVEGKHLNEMKEVLEFYDMDITTINHHFQHLVRSLVDADKDIAFSSADSVWLEKHLLPYDESFTDVLEEFYDAGFNTFDCQNPTDATKTINNWISENTAGKIEEMIDGITCESDLFIINAIFFKGTWTTRFDKDASYSDEFTRSDGTTTTVEMMKFEDNQPLDYYHSNREEQQNFRIVRLPYGREIFSFYGIIPDSGSIDTLISEINEKGIDYFLSKVVEKDEVFVTIPKFSFSYGLSLLEIMRGLGMQETLSEKTLINLTEDHRNIGIDDIKHKTFINVDEAGTEAAASTVVEGYKGGPPSFSARSPFVYVIRDDRSGTTLFMGKVEDPVAE